MNDIENAVIAAASVDVKSLETRIKALEAEASGYVKVHMVYFLSAICLVVGGVAGHVLR